MKSIGFIGLGLMGKPMAKNLLKAGFSLTVHSRSRGPVDEFAALGVQAAHSAREVAAASEVVITIVPDSPDVEAVVAGPEGILAGAKPGLIHIDMSTISPVAIREKSSDCVEGSFTVRTKRCAGLKTAMLLGV